MKKIIIVLIAIGCAYGASLVYQQLTLSVPISTVLPIQNKAITTHIDKAQNSFSMTTNNSAISIQAGYPTASNVEVNHQFAYILNSNSTTISKCDINQSSGQLENCSNVGRGFNAPTGIAITKNHLWLYVTNRGENNVSICQIESQSGELVNCHYTDNQQFNNPTGITLDEINNIAYVTNVANNSLSRCIINPSNMDLINCIQYKNQTFDYPTDIKLNINNANLFIVNAGNNSITRCKFNEEQQQLDCSTVLDNLSEPQAIFFTRNNVYIPNRASKLITRCSSQLQDNHFTNCTNFAGGFTNVTDIATDDTHRKIYITDEQKVSVCEEMSATATLNCHLTGSGFNSPSGLYLLNEKQVG